MDCDCLPILPDRRSNPSVIPNAQRTQSLHNSERELVALLRTAILDIDQTRATSLRATASRYDWATLGPVYDDLFDQIARSGPATR